MDDKVQQLWRLQLALNKFVGETEAKLDPSLSDLFSVSRPPDWFNSGIVFSPLVLAFENKIHEKQDRIYDLQQEALDLVEAKSKVPPPDPALGEKIAALRKELDGLKQEIESVSNEPQPPDPGPTIYDDEITRLGAERAELSEENEKLKAAIPQWLAEIEMGTQQYIASCHKCKNNRIESKKCQAKIKELDEVLQTYVNSTEYHNQKEQRLDAILRHLSQIQKKNQDTIAELEENCREYRELLAKFKKIQQLITESGSNQEKVMIQMIEAADLAEKASAQARKHRVNRDMHQAEIKRIQSVLNRASQEADKLISDYEILAGNHYEPIIEEIGTRIQNLKLEQKRLNQQKELIQKEIEDQTERTATLQKPDVSEAFLNYQKIYETKYDQKVTLLKSIEGTRKKIADLDAQCGRIGPKARSDAILLRRQAQVLEMQVSNHRQVLTDRLASNAVVTDENSRLQDAISSIQRAADIDLRERVIEVQGMASKLQQALENESRENQIQCEEIRAELIQAHLIGEQNHAQALQMLEESHEVRGRRKTDLESVRAESRRTEEILNGNREELLKGRRILRQTTDQVTLLRKQIAQLQKKERRQSQWIEKLRLQQSMLASENQRLHELSRTLSERISNGQNLADPEYRQIDVLEEV